MERGWDVSANMSGPAMLFQGELEVSELDPVCLIDVKRGNE
jgi:hypothetical protein